MFKEAAQLEHEIATPFVGGAPDQFATKALATERASENYTAATFMGWRRENGRVGVRNHVVLLPLDDLSNAACEAVANNVKGTMALPHAYGRLQFGEDLDLHFRTLIGIGSNPNVAAVVVIGIEDQWTNRVVEGIARTGKPVVGFGIEGHGDIAIVAKASYQAKRFVQWATELQREECPIADLWVSTKCGESDTTTGLASCPTVGNMYDKLIPHGIYGVFGETSEITGAEHLCRERAISPEVSDKWYAMWKAYQDDVIEAHKTDDLSDSQPTKGNIAGGLTTIEEKALGNLEKIGHECRFIDALQPAEAPTKGPGLYFMDTSSAAAECVTLMAAAGYVVHTFPTGQGNVIGNPIVPVIKITGNPRTVRTMGEHIDVDVSGVLTREMTIPQAGDALIDMVVRTANGRLTAAESLGHREFVMTKLYRSA
ncbi:(2R)-sulfolactate sulfo-lyase subunit beta [Methylobacterium sp. PvP062]|jgi:(2R)-sulfolactate sulfo-lyase subunit beta|uniref:Altronate dehydratase n=2 Tax=Methylobacterium radiotolerans TaxID=31998 RepID=B1M8U1_METRJ|nr:MULTISPECIES: UxaA family hydrolase [Methylobacterium]GAN47251.1 altronate dehydratase [Methylobacterium sp. ME121]ACB27916.1 Altronate dehydratase [Methylobacterium radiotolerans JCM 2831]MBP2498851.1 (2R)-sulfolactate sulfo-lyase subunit beta [Methylobacterium sp. PvP105]MBP2505863.1 (2R)-sulfolactate sulfo-lyase subunit beta [Methylobacterium sp. PvP109]OXE43466.1 D-galactarate dehydratase [Methylobacterium radiotolerans]